LSFDLDKTFCLGYWAVSDNAKRSLAHYTELLPATLGMLAGRSVVFFYDDEQLLERISGVASRYGITLHPQRVSLEELPEREAALNVLKATEAYGKQYSEPPALHKKEKALRHYWRDYGESGRDAYLNILCIWLSKIALVRGVVEENPFSSERFAWVDASVARFSKKRDFYDVGRVADCRDRISFYRGKMVKNGEKLALNASYMSGSAEAWGRLDTLFQEKLLQIQDEVYPNDEETVLDLCYREEQMLFRMINPRRHRIIVRLLARLGLGAYRWRCY
jgi:hypothetical protein